MKTPEQIKSEHAALLAAAEMALKSLAGKPGPRPPWYMATLAAVSQIHGEPTTCVAGCWFCEGDGHHGGTPCPMGEAKHDTTQGSQAA